MGNYWILSANPNYFDHAGAFHQYGHIDWKQTRNYSVGDIVYVYVTKPISTIRYKTQVVCINMRFEDICDFERYWIVSQPDYDAKARFVRLRLLQEYEDDRLRFEILKNHGMGYPPQGPCRVNNDLLSYIRTVEV